MPLSTGVRRDYIISQTLFTIIMSLRLANKLAREDKSVPLHKITASKYLRIDFVPCLFRLQHNYITFISICALLNLYRKSSVCFFLSVMYLGPFMSAISENSRRLSLVSLNYCASRRHLRQTRSECVRFARERAYGEREEVNVPRTSLSKRSQHVQRIKMKTRKYFA